MNFIQIKQVGNLQSNLNSLSDSIYQTGQYLLTSDQGPQTFEGVKTFDDDVYFEDIIVSTSGLFGGPVGIGTAAPDYELDVAGDIGVDHYIRHNGDANTHINFTNDKIVLKAGNKAMITMEEKGAAPHEVAINDGSNNIDFVVKGNGSNEGNPLLKTDASTGRVGINGVGSPAVELEVDGTIAAVGSDPKIGIGTTSPSAPLEVSSTEGGVIVPRMTTAERNAIAAPTDGEMIYNTDDNKFQGRANATWEDLH